MEQEIKQLLKEGTVIPAHPLALNSSRMLDEERQRLLTRYYIASGAGGVAVGVHTTQFEIRKPSVNLYAEVLKLAAEEIARAGLKKPFIKVAGICGNGRQAMAEAQTALQYGYHLGLVNLAGLDNYSEEELIKHVQAISTIIPVFGFYLQPAIGGRIFSYNFWRQFTEIPNVYAIKIAAFNRYFTLDVVRAVCSCSRADEIALYTGNDDNIVADLLTPYRFTVNGAIVEKRFVGGLLGHWAVWTSKAVELLNEIKNVYAGSLSSLEGLFTKGVAITDMNAAIFDPHHSFNGCIPGIHEVLRRQGLLPGRWCLDEHEDLSAGQLEEIERIYASYHYLTDDAFVHNFLTGKTANKKETA
ncbi:MAG TPA: dihydrodipicolinate synthase family protein [Chitinophagaceae bacterium]|nr:dihydrodipicolinate synthase family protein [Chitinophagaceae bacterium]